MEKIIWTTLIHLLGTVIFLPFFSHADGCLMLYDYDVDRSIWVGENRQVGYINYINGYEHLILSVILDHKEDIHISKGDLFWIFPIPTQPEDISIDVIQDFSFPSGGVDVEEIFDKKVMTWNYITLYSQIYPAPFLYILAPLFRYRGSTPLEEYRKGEEEITRHKIIEKMGLRTEIITAKKADALVQYFKDIGISIPEEANSLIEEYIGKNYSFVVSRVVDYVEFMKTELGVTKMIEFGNQKIVPPIKIKHPIQVYLKFKTDKIFFPLKFTSIYRNSRIYITVFVVGHVTPENLPQESYTKYYVKKENYTVPSSYADFFGDQKKITNFSYSKIKIFAIAKEYTEDLYINNRTPKKVLFALFVTPWVNYIYLGFFIIVSCMSSVLAGWIVFPPAYRPEWYKMLTLGLFNCLTFVGYIIAGNYFLKKYFPQIDPEIKKQVEEIGLEIKNNVRLNLYKWFTIIFLYLMFILWNMLVSFN